ncbi:carbohydrate ABC transporter permease [Nesterenkonia alba]|uniref:carbohydrate ABC transporter permease n=1 Tax=Nesterenkonia alba TaxID=515814 RepID=UPI0003B748FE|nr:carbohydrate ABC transporter permease [Nesterenkonia alba]
MASNVGGVAFRYFSYAVLSAALVVVLLPLMWLISTAFKDDTDLFSTPPSVFPEQFTFESFLRIWTEYPFLQYFQNSIIVVLSATIIAVGFASFAGYGIARFTFPGRGAFLLFLLMTQMFPSILLLIPYYSIMQSLGLINTLLALIVTYSTFTIPLCTWMMWGFFKGIPVELDEAASIDGLGRLGAFVRIILPLGLPGLAATAIYAFIQGWNEYVFALVLTQTDDVRPVSVGIGNLVGEDRIFWNDLMAASLVALIPMLLIFGFLQRHLIAGLTGGSVKG